MASGPITSWQMAGETIETDSFYLLGSKIIVDCDCSHEIKTRASWKQSYDQLRPRSKKQRHYFANRGPPSQSYGFSSSHVWMWELDYKEVWALKNLTLLDYGFGEDSWESLDSLPWTARRVNQSILNKVNPEYSLEAEAEVPILWPLDEKSLFIGKDPDAGETEGRRRREERTGWLADITD